MRSGKFSQMNLKYEEDACVIWLENFVYDSEVHITNECSHVFHSKWINTWFYNIHWNCNLTCPHWTSAIKPDSPKPELNTIHASDICSQSHLNIGESRTMNATFFSPRFNTFHLESRDIYESMENMLEEEKIS